MAETSSSDSKKIPYPEDLKLINGIKFTRRQIDAIACLVNVWEIKAVADRLNVEPNTAKTHIDAISQKVGGGGRSSILAFVEKSGKIRRFREHYENLIKGTKFEHKKVLNPPTPEPFELFKRHKFHFVGGALFALAGIFFLVYLHVKPAFHKGVSPDIRSELSLPHESTLLRRPQILETMDENLKKQKGIQTIALIGVVGIGGAGKTTLARHYALSAKDPIVWEINAETKEALINSFRDLAYAMARTEEEKRELRILKEMKNPEEREKRLLFIVKEKLRNQPSWLLIYDNVENLKEIRKYVPSDLKVWGRGKVIVTTQDKSIRLLSPESVIDVQMLSHTEKYILFKNILYGKNKKLDEKQKNAIEAFLKNIPPFPLDVVTAAYYIKDTKISLEDYIKRTSDMNESFEMAKASLLSEISPYTKTRYGIITLALKKLIQQNPDFEELLLLISLLDSQNIPLELLKNLKPDTVVDQFIHQLRKYSFITDNENISQNLLKFSLHRSIQRIIASYLVNSPDLIKNTQIFEKIGEAFENHLALVVDEDDFLKIRSHCKMFLKHPFLPAFSQGMARYALASTYFHLGNYKKTENLLRKNLSASNVKDQRNQKVIARTLAYLGNTSRILGKFKEAQEYFKKGLEIYRKYSPDDHDKIAWVLAQIGIMYRDLKNYEKAKEFVKRSLTLYRRHLPDTHIKISWALATLGTVYVEFKDYKKAKAALEKSLEIYQKRAPENLIRKAWVSAHLGMVHYGLGQYEKAKKFLEESLAVYETYFFDGHIENVRTLRYLGKVYGHLGAYKKAEEVLNKSIELCEKNYDKAHFDVAWGLTSLLEISLLQGDVIAAKEYLKKASLLLRQKPDPMYVMMLETFSNTYLEKALKIKNKENSEFSQALRKEAANLLQQALAITPTNLHKQDPYIFKLHAKLKKLEKSTQA